MITQTNLLNMCDERYAFYKPCKTGRRREASISA